MPYVEGETLRARLRREQQLPVTEAVRIAKELAAALAYAHAQGVIHRDIKPENVLLARPNAGSPPPALLADFGIARALDSPANRLTGTGMAVGTAAYMSPEQATAERELDGRSDVYSLGCVLYEMLAGEPPFTGPNPRAILAKSLADPVRPVGRIRDGIPPYIEAALAMALGRAPADRFPDMSAFGAALEAQETTRGPINPRLVAGNRRLDSWKEVASYLGRGVRTVQRWERDEGLPVHRLAHEKRGSIYAYSHEVDAWWESRRVTLSAEQSADDVACHTDDTYTGIDDTDDAKARPAHVDLGRDVLACALLGWTFARLRVGWRPRRHVAADLASADRRLARLPHEWHP